MALEVAAKAIRDEIRRLTGEMQRLEAALHELDGRRVRSTTTAARGRTSPTATAKANERKAPRTRAPRRSPQRARRGQRREQVLSIIKMRPGISNADLAHEAGVTPAYVSRLVKQLESEKKLRRAKGALRAR
jgi:CRP-like cAMP-binding protein